MRNGIREGVKNDVWSGGRCGVSIVVKNRLRNVVRGYVNNVCY